MVNKDYGYTTITILKRQRAKLDKLKVHERETDYELVDRILKEKGV